MFMTYSSVPLGSRSMSPRLFLPAQRRAITSGPACRLSWWFSPAFGTSAKRVTAPLATSTRYTAPGPPGPKNAPRFW